MSITVINPWHKTSYEGSNPTLTYTDKCLLSYRGVEVYWNPRGSYDYTFNGMAITQRAGMSDKNKARAVIDALLDGDDATWRCETVAAHIAKHQTVA
jgi:hypothetical protein